MVGCRSCTVPSIHLFMALTLTFTVGYPSSTCPSFLMGKNLYTRVGLLGPSALQRSGELWARPLVLTLGPSQANFTSEPQLSSCLAVGSRRVKIVRNLQTCLIPWSVFRNNNDGKISKHLLCLSLSGNLGLVVGTQAREVRGVIFHTTRWTQCRADCTATENRTDCEHGRHRPATATPTPTKSSANSCAIAVQVERLQEGGRELGYWVLLKFVDSSSASTWKASLTPVSHYIGRRCRHWPRRWLYTPDKRQVP